MINMIDQLVNRLSQLESNGLVAVDGKVLLPGGQAYIKIDGSDLIIYTSGNIVLNSGQVKVISKKPLIQMKPENTN